MIDASDDFPEEDSTGPLDRLPLDWNFKTSQKVAYGGVLIATDGRLLLREVANHYDGYIWTFPKGRPDPGEAPRKTAFREVVEETGVDARILTPIAYFSPSWTAFQADRGRDFSVIVDGISN